MKGCIAALGIIVAVALIALGVFSYRVNQAGDKTPTRIVLKASEEAAKSLDNKVDTITKAVATASSAAKPVPIKIVVTDEELNSKLAQLGEVRSGDLLMRNIRVQTFPNEIEIAGQATFAAIELPFTMTAGLTVQEGKPLVSLKSAQFGSLPAPDPLKAQLGTILQDQISTLLANSLLSIEEIHIEQGSITLIGSAKPR